MRLREGAEGRLGSDWPIKAAPGSNQFAILHVDNAKLVINLV